MKRSCVASCNAGSRRRSAPAYGYASESGVSAAEPPFEIVGVVRDLGLDPGEQGDEAAYVFQTPSAATVSPLVMSVRLGGNPAALAARLPAIAADVDGGLSVLEAPSLGESIWQRDYWRSAPTHAGCSPESWPTPCY